MMKVGAGEFIKTNSGEVIWGSEAFIDEVFKTLYGNKFRDEIWSYDDALNKIKNLVCGDISDEHKELIFKELKDTSISFLDENNNFKSDTEDFRLRNIDLALLSVNKILDKEVNPTIISKIKEYKVQGRFEIIDNDPVKILDGAHNISGFETLFQNLEHLYKDIDFDCYLGLKEGKKYEKILDFLSQIENISINIIEDNSFYNQMSSKYLQSYLEERNINFQLSPIGKFLSLIHI